MLRQQRLGMSFPVSQKEFVSSLLPQICMANDTQSHQADIWHAHMRHTPPNMSPPSPAFW